MIPQPGNKAAFQPPRDDRGEGDVEEEAHSKREWRAGESQDDGCRVERHQSPEVPREIGSDVRGFGRSGGGQADHVTGQHRENQHARQAEIEPPKLVDWSIAHCVCG